jgi:response regulator RpfG family c-di-GMP phosphodiesterase
MLLVGIMRNVYDALVSKRVYKEAWDFEGACQEIIHQRGKSFDPVIVDAFLAERKNFEKIALKYKDEH